MKKAISSYRKKLALFLALIMVLTMVPMNVFANNMDTKTIYVTVSNAGEIQFQKDGKTGMARIPIEVPLDAKLDDVIHKVHVDYHQDGDKGYTEIGGFYSKFWGTTTYNIGYVLNGIMTDAANITDVSNGDEVDAFIYKDYKTDQYSKFDRRYATVNPGEALTLTLAGHGIFDTVFSPIKGAKLLIDDGSRGMPDDDSNNFITNEDGQASLWFPKAGTYSISAKMSKESAFAITAPICKIEVTGTDLTPTELTAKTQEDSDNIILPGVVEGSISSDIEKIELPKVGKINYSQITWKSSNPSVISDEGGVIRTTSIGNATLTATVDSWGTSVTKDFPLQVSAITESEIVDIVYDIAAEFTVNKLTPIEFSGKIGEYYSKHNSMEIDKNILTKAQSLADAIREGTTISLISRNSAIASDGTITYGDSAVSGEIEFTIEMSGIENSILLDITVPAHATSKTEALEASWLNFEVIKSKNMSEDSIITNLILPKEDPNGYYTEIEWTVDNSDVLEISSYATNQKYTGKVIRPKFGEESVQIEITAKIKPGMYWDYSMAPAGPMPNPAYGEKAFVLTVLAVTGEEQSEAQTLVDEGIKLFDLDKVTIRGTKEKADLNALTYSINDVPFNWNHVNKEVGFKDDYRVINVSWSSENSGIGKVDSGAVVTRTAIDQEGDIVLTLSYNGAEAVKRFPTVVKAFTEGDAELENDILEGVANSLTFGVIKGNNTHIGEVTENLVKKEAAVKLESRIDFKNAKEYHHVGANITWKSSNASVITDGLKVTRPEENTSVILTATLRSPKYGDCPGVNEVEKKIIVTVLGTGEEPLVTNIAKSYGLKDPTWWTDEGNWWHAVGMNAYKASMNDTSNVVTSECIQAFVDKTIAQVENLNMAPSNASSNSGKLASAINGMSAFGYDATKLWTAGREKIDGVSGLKSVSIEDAKQGWYSTVAPYVINAYKQGNYGTEVKENEHVQYLIEELNNVENWNWGVDTPAMILHGLMNYYDRSDVKIAVDQGISKLSELQGENGSFGSSNSDAVVIITLSGLGINVDTDDRFIKGGNSLLDGLYSYEVNTNSGFAYSVSDVDKAPNDMSTIQGFIALISAYEVNAKGVAYNPFDFSNTPKEEAYAKGTGESNPLPPPSGTEDITVTFTLKTDTGTWIPRTTVTVKENAVVYHIVKQALNKNDYIFQDVGNNYIASITNPSGNKLGEFDKGDRSGWMFRVNRELSPVGMRDFKVSDGDDIVLFFTLDWTKESGAFDWQGSKDKSPEEKTTDLVAKEDGKGSATVEVSKAEMDKLVKDGGLLMAKSSIATIEMDAATLKDLAKQMGKDLEITAKKVDISQRKDISQEMKDEIGDRPVLDLTVMSGTKEISKFDGQVRVSIPYTLKKGEDPNAVVIYLIKDNGDIEIIRNGEFDPLTKEIKFTTSHFSLYGIAHRDLTFNDIDGHWAKEYITYLAARDYITGMSKDSFAPNGTLTRGQFVQLLANLASVDLGKYGSTLPSSINDVKTTDWFAPAVAWALGQGVVTGDVLPDGTTSFYPEKSISRQDIAVMLNRYRDNIDKKAFPETVKEKTFQDNNQISDYAKDSVKALQKTGIIQGKTETTFAPLDQAKRGEAAKMIHGMLKLN